MIFTIYPKKTFWMLTFNIHRNYMAYIQMHLSSWQILFLQIRSQKFPNTYQTLPIKTSIKFTIMSTKKQSKNKFWKDLYKLMNNPVFRKTMENIDNRKDIKLITKWDNRSRSVWVGSLITRPNFKNCSILNENFVAIHMDKTELR